MTDAEELAALRRMAELESRQSGEPLPYVNTEKPIDVPAGVASMMNIAQAPAMGFADELYGAASTLGGGDYATHRDRFRATVDNFRKEYPRSALLGSVSGGLATGLGAARAIPQTLARFVPQIAAPESVVTTLANTAAVGGASGMLQGLGDANTSEPKDLLAGAAMMGGIGMIGGPVAQAVGGAGGAVARNIGSRFGANIAEDAAGGEVMKALIRDLRAARGGLESFSDAQVGEMAIMQARRRMQTLGPRAVLADVGASGGVNTRELLDTLNTLPGQTKTQTSNLVHARQTGRGADMQDAAARYLSPGGRRLGETVDSLMAARRTSAQPLYNQVHAMDVPATPQLSNIVQGLDKLGALNEARTLATSAVARGGPAEAFTLTPTDTVMKMRDLDRAKQGLDAVIQSNTDAVTGKMNTKAVEFNKLRLALIDELDKATTNPQTGVSIYKQARDAYAGPSQMIDAANLGRRAMGGNDASVAEATKGMTDSELRAFRVGAFESLRDKLGTQSGRTQVMNMWQESKTSDKLKEIFGDERSFREFAASVAKERRLKMLDASGQGSQTASREARIEDMNASVLGDVAGAAASMKAGNPAGIVSGVRNVWGRMATPEPVRDAAGNLLLSRPSTNQMDMLSQLMAARAARNAEGAAQSGVWVPSMDPNR